MNRLRLLTFVAITLMLLTPNMVSAQRTQKPVLHAKHWIAITGKPMAATAGSMMYQRGGNAVDAAMAKIGRASCRERV